MRVFSALLRVIAVISVADEDVSSSVAACSDVPCASDWLADATCPAAPATCREPSSSSVADAAQFPIGRTAQSRARDEGPTTTPTGDQQEHDPAADAT